MKQAKWLELWREVTGDERITQVDVRRLKNSADKGAAEVAAYTAKDSEYMLSQEVFDVFYNALRGRQILTYNGLFTTGNKLFKSKQLDKFREKIPPSMFGFSCIAGAWASTSKPKNED